MVMKQDRKIGAIMRKAIDEKRSLTKRQLHKKAFFSETDRETEAAIFQPSLIFTVEIRVWIHENFLKYVLTKVV
jgi:hypothetical protein